MDESYYLETIERERLLSQMSSAQRNFLNRNIQRKIQSKFLNTELLDGARWQVVDFKYDPDRTGKLKCDCGRSLKYQYWIKDMETGITHKLGVTHLSQHLKVPVSIANRIARGTYKVNLGLDEILTKYKNGVLIDSNVTAFARAYNSAWSNIILESAKLELPIYDQMLDGPTSPYRHYLRDVDYLETSGIDTHYLHPSQVFKKVRQLIQTEELAKQESLNAAKTRNAKERKQQALERAQLMAKQKAKFNHTIQYFDYFGQLFSDFSIDINNEFSRKGPRELTSYEVCLFCEYMAEQLAPGDFIDLNVLTRWVIRRETAGSKTEAEDKEAARHRLFLIFSQVLNALAGVGMLKSMHGSVVVVNNNKLQITDN